MDRKKEAASSSSSLSSDHLGSKNLSTGVFASVFPSASTGSGTSSRSDVIASLTKQDTGDDSLVIKQQIPDNNTQSRKGHSSNIPCEDRSSIYQHQRSEPCTLSSSLLYGGQDSYCYSKNTRTYPSKSYSRKDGADSDENNPDSASRGNWWQGSVYY